MLVFADWDDTSKHLLQMFQLMPQYHLNCKFNSINADEATDLVDKFEVDSVPALIVVHPHKNQHDLH